MSKASVSLDRIREIMNAAPQEDRPDAEEPDMSGDIVFEDVSFAYPAESTKEQDEDSPGKEPRQVLEHLSLTIPAGSTVGILGGTGSGKSTLVRLLTRLYELPEGQGRITVGGHDIAHIRLKWLRRHIGTVLQEPYLFSGSIAENIAVTKDRTDLNAVRKYAGMAALDSTVAHFADGYETYIGERGMTLSGGQIQRAAIARMLMGEPPVMIFDDSLSAVDAATDQEIRARLREQMQGRTVILIAHRITTLMDADRICLLDRGRIIERGSHRELLEKGGLYRRIYDLQSSQGEFDTEA